MIHLRGTTASAVLIFMSLMLVVHQAYAGVTNSHQGPGRRNRAGILYGRARDDDSSWVKCKKPVCQEVGRQAEGLLRLKDLRNYIVETMRLMDSLVTSVDAELVNQGAELSKFVGPLCTDTHEILLNITIPSANANMDMGVGGPLSHNVDSFPSLNNEATAVTKTSGMRRGKIDSMWAEDAEQGELEQDSSESISVKTYTSSGSSSNKRRPSDGRQLLHQVGTNPQYGPHGATGSVTSGGTPPSTSGGGGGGGYGGANSISDSGDRRPPPGGFGTGEDCRGVEPGSVHYVPGLDGWCASNCPTGYCPETHCVCS